MIKGHLMWIKPGILLLSMLAQMATGHGTSVSDFSNLGRCPPSDTKVATLNCSRVESSFSSSNLTCESDSDCEEEAEERGRGLCCFDGCHRVCLQPVYTACEHQRISSVKRARALTAQQDVADEAIRVASCLADGRFDPVQCTGKDGDTGQQCWCVDESGFEIGGTRTKSRDTVNCTSPRPCAGHLCRMLCPFDFELDENGCPLCQCRDPCRGVRCPGGTQCQLEVVNCLKEPCPPVPTCKQARSLDNVCPIGRALTVSDKDKLFLCGHGPTKPQCPDLFTCEIQPQRDYGVCCPSPDKLEKPGTCPETSRNGSFVSCGLSCHHDMECEGLQKCCSFDDCGGFACVPMAENTACLQQRILAELLSSGEKVGRGYIPQCTSTGMFNPRQCSRNGRVCWCVDPNGTKVPRTMGPSDVVRCENLNEKGEGATAAADALEPLVSRSCDIQLCTTVCPYGYEVDANGCQTCDCTDLCESIKCPSEMECVIVDNDFCEHDPCDSFPVCKPPPILYSKPGSCPSTKVQVSKCTNVSCSDDSHCSGVQKCCKTNACSGFTCLEPVSLDNRLPTMCEYLRDFGSNAVDQVRARAIAFPIPTCQKDGSFERVQCNGLECWCVDEFGSEITSSRVAASMKTKVDCDIALRRKSCDGLLCRLGCDYGFERDVDDCPICECRNPCHGIDCDGGFQCQMVEVDCYGGFCPSVPQCVPTRPSLEICPMGLPLRHPLTNVTRACGPSSPCPAGYFCHSESEQLQTTNGVCCRKPFKPGQCPYRFVPKLGHCENMSTCDSDHQCTEAKKCCSDGCRSSCVEPEMMTGCEHTVFVARFMAEQSSLVLGELPVPRCEDEDGAFAQIQCHGRSCWCVDSATGREVSGTRTKDRPHTLNCTAPSRRSCPPLLHCDLTCRHSFRLNDKGCPMCACHDPCEDLLCSRKNEECQLVEVNCITEPCPPIPMCVLRPDNPCPHGHPIRDRLCSSLPGFPTCPSTHVCFRSPFEGLGSVCCPKPREVCLQSPEFTVCRNDSAKRWIFSMTNNVCEETMDSNCPTSTNSFYSKTDCEATCPVLSECEMAREKALHRSKQISKLGFIPKCRKDGDWESVQCLPEVGLCWCVSVTGDYIKGTAVRGTPRCGSARMGRRLGLEAGAATNVTTATTTDVDRGLICLEDQTVHRCNASLCDGKVCLGQPNAACRVDPCGGCHYRFYVDEKNIDCNEGLSECQRQVQTVLNSDSWSLRIMDFLGVFLEPQIEPSEASNLFELFEKESDDPATRLVKRHSTASNGDVSKTLEDVVNRNRYPTQQKKTSPLEVEIDSLTTREAETTAGDEELRLSPPLSMVTLPPRCSMNGDYERVQRQGELSWCVDIHGKPLHKTITRGHVKCGEDGTMLDRKETGPVCSDQTRVPRVCTDECIRSECVSHPEALCLADPCDDCRVSFVATDGEKVNCDEKCHQPLEIGMCRAAFPRFFFNSTVEKCQSFVYGGCLGNENNFNSLEQCEDDCMKPVSLCSLPKRVGMCRASMKRWWFNKKTQECEQFIFGGCDGNENNFESREQCEAICPDVVLCPRFPLLHDAEPCKRSTLCSNLTCEADPDAVCTVDPCDCRLYFVDYDGLPVECTALTNTDLSSSSSSSTAATTTMTTTTALSKHSRLTPCLKRKASQCDEHGAFSPTQCEDDRRNDTKCWCVDEAGKRIPESPNFVRGTQHCKLTKVDNFLVNLVFEHDDQSSVERRTEQIRTELMSMLKDITGSIVQGDVTVNVLPRTVQVNFTLDGNDKVDVAYTIEQKMVAGEVVLPMSGLNLQSSLIETRLKDFSGHIGDDVEKDIITEGTVAFLVCIVIVIVLMGILFATFVVVHKRRNHGYYPRDTLDSLSPVTNSVYGFESTVGKGAILPQMSLAEVGEEGYSNILERSQSPVSNASTVNEHHYEVLERTSS